MKKSKWFDIDQDWKDLIIDTNITFMEILAVIVTSALLGLMTFNLLSTPGGLPGVFASIMVQAGQAVGTYDFQMLFAGLGLAMVLLTSFSAFTMMIIKEGVDRIGNDNNSSPVVKIPPYPKEQYEALLFIQSMGEVENLAKMIQWVNAPYQTLYRWVEEFEKDGFVKIHRNGKGSPLKIESLCKADAS
jgi:hypothetical protein